LIRIESGRSRNALGEVGLSRNSCTPRFIAANTRKRWAQAVSMTIGRFGFGNTPGERTTRRRSLRRER